MLFYNFNFDAPDALTNLQSRPEVLSSYEFANIYDIKYYENNM